MDERYAHRLSKLRNRGKKKEEAEGRERNFRERREEKEGERSRARRSRRGCLHTCLHAMDHEWSQVLVRLRQEDCLISEVWSQPGLYNKTPSLTKKKKIFVIKKKKRNRKSEINTSN